MKFNPDIMNNMNKELLQPEDLSSEGVENLKDKSEKYEDLENKADIAIEEDEQFENKTEGRLENWRNKSKEEKIKVVEEKRGKLEKDLGKNVETPKDVTRLKEYQGELKKKNKEFIEEREDIVNKIQVQLDGSIDLSDLDLGNRSEFKNVLSSFRNVTKNTLEIEKADYYLEAGENELGDLLDTHEDREITMEILEKIMGQISDFEKYLEELENMTGEQLEAAEEEVRGLMDRLNDIYNKNPELFKKLLAAGVVIGVLILAAVVLGPLVAGTYEWATALEIGNIAFGATKAFFDCLGKRGAMTAGAVVGGSILFKALSWISDEKNRDSFAELLCGAKISGIAYWPNGRPSDKKPA